MQEQSNHISQDETKKENLDLDNSLLASSVRKIGAEILLTIERSMHSLENNKPLAPSDVNRHTFKIELLERENKQVDQRISSLFTALITNSQEWSEKVINADIESSKEATLNYFQKNWKIFTSLSQLTSLRSLPLASDLDLSIVEFDTEVSGIPTNRLNINHKLQAPSFSVLNDIVKLEESLIIDQKLNQPQSGFAFAESENELLSHLRKRQAHLFVAYQGTDLIGFYLPIFNRESVKSAISKTTLKQLKENGVFTDSDNLSWGEIVGTSKSNRLSLAKSGVNLYSLFDQVVVETAKKEGSNVILGLVRQGEQANLSLKTHLRSGCKITNVTQLGADTKTPYMVLSRRLSEPSEIENFEYANLSTGSHFEVIGSLLKTDQSLVEEAKYITNEEALELCKDFFSHITRPPEIIDWQGYHEFSIQIKDDSCCHYFIRQARPYSDIWTYRSDSRKDSTGSLLEVLSVVSSDLNYPINPEYKSKA